MNATERHQFLEVSIARTEELLRQEVVKRWIGPAAVELTVVGRKLFIPNVHHGQVVFPKKYMDTDMVPVVALRPQHGLRPGQEASLLGREARMTPGQRRRSIQALVEHSFHQSTGLLLHEMDDMLSQMPGTVQLRKKRLGAVGACPGQLQGASLGV